jgi:hypothetical protein
MTRLIRFVVWTSQFAQQQGKITLSEFVSFVKVEGSIQQLLNKLPQLIDN